MMTFYFKKTFWWREVEPKPPSTNYSPDPIYICNYIYLGSIQQVTQCERLERLNLLNFDSRQYNSALAVDVSYYEKMTTFFITCESSCVNNASNANILGAATPTRLLPSLAGGAFGSINVSCLCFLSTDMKLLPGSAIAVGCSSIAAT